MSDNNSMGWLEVSELDPAELKRRYEAHDALVAVCEQLIHMMDECADWPVEVCDLVELRQIKERAIAAAGVK